MFNDTICINVQPCEKPMPIYSLAPVQHCAWVIWDPGCGIHRQPSAIRKKWDETWFAWIVLSTIFDLLVSPKSEQIESYWWIRVVQIYSCCHYHWSLGLATLHQQQEATLKHPGERRIWARTPKIGSFPKLLSMEILIRVVFHGQVWEFSDLDLSMEIVHARKFQVDIC